MRAYLPYDESFGGSLLRVRMSYAGDETVEAGESPWAYARYSR